MPHYVYILQSFSTGRYYAGETADVAVRLSKHNSGSTTSTRHGVPWRIIHVISCETRRMSLQLEKQIKKRGISRWLTDHGVAS
ncbi:GIY-YIG nuclease family protein [Chitinophaga polysaccharea]|uniref:GIY-YIG nuclease family protein n=1 Tax=Chitinophaga polysaccharea TaxID=1293035 RepID=UPI001455405B|nr:GIY-YIG nuclease family protein [Chitinophaga polysaccharea]